MYHFKKYLKYKSKYLNNFKGGAFKSKILESDLYYYEITNKILECNNTSEKNYGHTTSRNFIQPKRELLQVLRNIRTVKCKRDIDNFIILFILITNDGSGDYNWIENYIDLIVEIGYKLEKIIIIVYFPYYGDIKEVHDVLDDALWKSNSSVPNTFTVINDLKIIHLMYKELYKNDKTIKQLIDDVINYSFQHLTDMEEFLNYINLLYTQIKDIPPGKMFNELHKTTMSKLYYLNKLHSIKKKGVQLQLLLRKPECTDKVCDFLKSILPRSNNTLVVISFDYVPVEYFDSPLFNKTESIIKYIAMTEGGCGDIDYKTDEMMKILDDISRESDDKKIYDDTYLDFDQLFCSGITLDGCSYFGLYKFDKEIDTVEADIELTKNQIDIHDSYLFAYTRPGKKIALTFIKYLGLLLLMLTKTSDTNTTVTLYVHSNLTKYSNYINNIKDIKYLFQSESVQVSDDASSIIFYNKSNKCEGNILIKIFQPLSINAFMHLVKNANSDYPSFSTGDLSVHYAIFYGKFIFHDFVTHKQRFYLGFIKFIIEYPFEFVADKIDFTSTEYIALVDFFRFDISFEDDFKNNQMMRLLKILQPIFEKLIRKFTLMADILENYHNFNNNFKSLLALLTESKYSVYLNKLYKTSQDPDRYCERLDKLDIANCIKFVDHVKSIARFGL